jgi:high affinity Mn2+ porin
MTKITTRALPLQQATPSKGRSHIEIVRRWVETADARCPLVCTWSCLPDILAEQDEDRSIIWPAFSMSEPSRVTVPWFEAGYLRSIHITPASLQLVHSPFKDLMQALAALLLLTICLSAHAQETILKALPDASPLVEASTLATVATDRDGASLILLSAETLRLYQSLESRDATHWPLVVLIKPESSISALKSFSSTPKSLASSTAAFGYGQEGTPAPRADEQPSFMRLLERHGLHRRKNERWNAYGQVTYISGWKPSFPAQYTNRNGSNNSLLPIAERSFTGTVTLYLALRTWKGGEIYFVPELISENPLSQLKGIGGAIQDFELQKGGDVTPTLYRSRAYVRQTFGFGGHSDDKDSSPQQLGTTYHSHRLVIEAGNFSILDFFDKNAFDIDPRQGLFNLAFLTYAAYDFASDARGYSWGLVTELFWDKWAVRFGRITPPRDPNQLPIDWRLLKYYGDQVELEHHQQFHGQEGIVRVLGYRNRENIGTFSDAIAAFKTDPSKNATTCTGFNYGSNNEGAPDLCWARKPNTKIGLGIFAQQYVVPEIGVFARAMVSDGKSEVDAYTSTDRSVSFGSLARGTSWHRPNDVAGLALNLGWISSSHTQYLRLGGVDGFIGDGYITPASEVALDAFYSANYRKSFWVAGDYQRIINPAFNSDRGPVNIFSLKIHGEF